MHRTSRLVLGHTRSVLAFLLLGSPAVHSACASRVPNPPLPAKLEADRSSALIEFRLAHSEPGEGRTAIELDGSLLYIDPAPIASDPDFLDVRPTFQDGDLILWIDMSPEAASRMTEITAHNIGRRMALFFDSELVLAVVIQSSGGGSGVPLVARVPIADPERGARLVQSCWPAQ